MNDRGRCAADQQEVSFVTRLSVAVEQDGLQHFNPLLHPRQSLIDLLHQFGFFRPELLALLGWDPLQDSQRFDEDATHDGRTFKDPLYSENTSSSARPPKEVVLQKNGDQWESTAEEEILYYLRFDIDQKIKEGARLTP